MKALRWLAILATLGCGDRGLFPRAAAGGTAGSQAGAAGFGGSGGTGGVLPPTLEGVHAYVVDAQLAITPNSATSIFPPRHTFTLVLDFDARLARMGSAEGDGGGTFDVGGDGTLELKDAGGFAFRDFCFATLHYDRLTFRINGGILTGTASGKASPPHAFGNDLEFTARLIGSFDQVMPTLTPERDRDFTDPFVLGIWKSSEPLPESKTATLVSRRGARIELHPITPTSFGFIWAFSLPLGLLGYDETFTVVTDGLTDFAGNAAAPGPTFTTKPPPPFVPDAGFESLGAQPFAGGVITDGTNGPVIAGTRSFYFTPKPFVPGAPNASFSLRLAVKPGGKMVRFSYRYVVDAAASYTASFGLGLGSPGANIWGRSLAPNGGPRTPFQAPNQPALTLGPVQQATFTMPDGTKDEIFIHHSVWWDLCSSEQLAPPGIVIDDLRVE